jgi:hypothetical protein
VYVSRTYPSMIPYLKSLHLTIDSWRPNRAIDGWRMDAAEMAAALQDRGEEANFDFPMLAPTFVTAVPSLQQDVQAMLRLFTSPIPTRRCVRPTHSAVCYYRFADASGSGFGSCLFINNHVHFREGQWSTDAAAETSNFRELSNVIHAIESAVHGSLLHDAELFLFTDNMLVESAFHRSTTTSKRLFPLILRLHKLQMESLFIHVVHIAG